MKKQKGKNENIHFFTPKKEIRCLICNQNNTRVVDVKKNYSVILQNGQVILDFKNVICKNCGFVYMNPQFNSRQLSKIYGTVTRSSFGTEDDIHTKNWESQFNFIKKAIPKKNASNILDIGSGDGFFLSLFKKSGWEVLGLEPSKILSSKASKEYGVETKVKYFENFKTNNNYYLITMRHVLEHMINPDFVLKKCFKILKNDGFLFIEVPNVYKVFKGNLIDFFNFQHLFHFSPKTIEIILNRNGFNLLQMNRELNYGAMRLVAQKAKSPVKSKINLKDEYKYVLKSVEISNRKMSKIKSFILHELEVLTKSKKNRVAIFGAGFHTQELIRLIMKVETIEVAGLVDNDTSKQNRILFGHKVFHPKDFDKLSISAVIISSYANQEQIEKQLQRELTKGIEIIKLYKKVHTY